jgi:ABC-type glycerol-3-phosphate transport system substrate-binding protein
MKTTGKILIVFLLVVLLLSACRPAAQPTASEEVSTDGAVTITIWDFGGSEFEWIDSIAIPEFNKKYPNIKVEHLGVPESDYATKVDTAIIAGQVPDIALQSYMYKLWKAGHVLPLDSYMARDGIKPEDFFPIYESWGMLDGKAYVMPVNTYIWAMIYNKDAFDAAGVPHLTADSVITFPQWLEISRQVNVPADTLENRVFASTIFTPQWNAMNNYMSNPYVLGPDGRDCLNYATTNDWITTWDVLVTAYKEELTVDSGWGLVGETSWNDMIRQGKLAMLYGTYGDALSHQQAGMNVGLTGQPVVTPGWNHNVGAWMDAYGIMAGSKHPEEAWLFLKFLTEEVALMKANGDCEVCGNAPSLIAQADDWAEGDQLREDAFTLLSRVEPPPFSPDVWTAVDPFYEAFRLMTDENVPAGVAVQQAAEECQMILNELWETFESLGN